MTKGEPEEHLRAPILSITQAGILESLVIVPLPVPEPPMDIEFLNCANYDHAKFPSIALRDHTSNILTRSSAMSYMCIHACESIIILFGMTSEPMTAGFNEED